MPKPTLLRAVPVAVAAAGLAIMTLMAHSTPDLPRFVKRAKQAGTPVDRRLLSGDNEFGFQLFELLAKQKPGQNVFISPTSAALALQMAYNGANGETRRAMEQALDLQGLSIDQVNSANAALLAQLDSLDPAVKLRIANSIWVGKGGALPVKLEFVQRNRDYYGAQVGDLTGAPGTINAWVRQQTNGKIDSIIGQSDLANVVAVLVNAVYFKGQWARKFDPSLTKNAVFTTQEGRRRDVKMMHQSGKYDYYQGEGFQAVRLPYGAGRMCAYLLLPNKNTQISGLLAALTPQNWNAWQVQFHLAQGDIGVPRFRSEYEADLNPPLTALGMGIAFRPNAADFSELAGRPGDVWIGAARQKTYVDVNEEGTEAAAATGIVMSTRAVIQLKHFSMILDHPFVCILQDTKTGAILFLGQIVDLQS